MRLGKIQTSNGVYVFETTGKKKYLLVREGGFYPSNYAPRGEADNFCMYLRKHISGKIIVSVTQYGLDRIIEVKFPDSSLIFELFGKLNILYLEDDKIVNMLRRSKRLKKGGSYIAPESVNFLDISEDEFEELVAGKSKRELARILGIGNLIEEVYGEPKELRQNLIELSNKPLNSDEVEIMFKEGDKLDLKLRREKKLNAKRIKLQKSIDKVREKIEKYTDVSKRLKAVGKVIMSDLPKYDALIEDALKRGQKRIKVSLPKN